MTLSGREIALTALLILLSTVALAQGKRRAVVVGVAGFEHGYASLEYTARDARRTAAALEDLGYSVSLLAADADAGLVKYSDVLAALKTAASKSQPGDTLLFFFAGHGSRRMEKDYLLLSDSDPDKFATTALGVDTLSEIVTRSKATRRVFVIDACRNTSQRAEGKSGFADGKLDKGFKDALDKLATKQIPGADIQTAVLYACSPGETSKESLEERAGIFTQRFIQALQQPGTGGPITLAAVMTFVRSHMPAVVEQTPLLEGPDSLSIGVPLKRHGTPDVERPGVQNNSASHQFLKLNPTDGAELLYVPGGAFTMGDADQNLNPRHRVTLSGFYIYKNLVTVAQYRRFCDATGCPMPLTPPWGWKDKHPIVNVRWDDAQSYCKWAGVRLPTEAEWERAARGTDGRKYPWGDNFDNSRLWCSVNIVRQSTAPVGSFPDGASPCGALDMAGNAWQWCADWYNADYCKKPDLTNPSGPYFGTLRVLRGGSWGPDGPQIYRTANRGWFSPSSYTMHFGFRCASGE